jgi:prepilin-type N-terminal cleavage/methylation domain-containing protein
MKRLSYPQPRRSRGFTLMESVIVMLVLAVAGVAITAMQGKLFTGASTVKTMQVSSRLMLECAEQVLADRRHAEDGYAVVNSTNGFGSAQCGGVPALTGFTVPTVSITESFAGAACPSTFTCKTVTITQGGLAPVTLMLVDY